MNRTSVSWLEIYNVAGNRSKISSPYNTQNVLAFYSEPRYLTRYVTSCNVTYIVILFMSK
jgi:hypothetical protein